MTEQGGFIEIQGTGEGQAFSRDETNQMLDLAQQGITALIDAQKQALGF